MAWAGCRGVCIATGVSEAPRVRRVRSDGLQHVTVHGRDEVVVIAAEDFRQLQGGRTGQALVDVLQAPPCRDVEFALAPSVAAPVRDVELL